MSSVDATTLPTHDRPSYTASARFSSKSSVSLRLRFWASNVGSVYVWFSWFVNSYAPFLWGLFYVTYGNNESPWLEITMLQ